MLTKTWWKFKSILKQKFLKPEILVLNNKNFFLPRWGAGGYPNLSMSELWMIDLFKNHLEIGSGIFIDVGVNVGQTLLKLRAVNDVNYLGFEPNPDCVSYLHELIAINKISNVQIVPVGIANKNGLSPFNIYNGPMDSSASVVPHFNGRKAKERRVVPVLKMETICKVLPLDQIGIIKVDVEGAELEVLKSFQDLISRDLPDILLEVLPVKNSDIERNDRLLELQRLIDSLGYKIYRIIKNGNQVQKLEEVLKFDNQADLSKCDYLLTAKIFRK